MSKLKEILTQPDTIIFVGAGISVWAGLPTWSELVEELALFMEQGGVSSELVRAEARKGELLQAASYGFDKLTKQQVGEFIRVACRFGRANPHEIHRKIVSLGPRCFITTNYDDLIEQSLRQWQPERYYRPPVTNRHLTETAEIVHARAIDFIFKPHGDANDSESIILTREQYRKLLPQGERQAALESVKMLLASRPVLYLGFGLRDPDFIYVRDLLANTYKGGVRDHYAIMADVQEGEIDYWRRHYGIHLLSYETVERHDKSRDHSPLLSLLDGLLVETIEIEKNFDPGSSTVLLALARHAAVLGRQPRLSPEFPIRVRAENEVAINRKKIFHHGPVEKFLDAGPDRALLVGLPGAGKTYSLRQAAARLAEQLNKTCLDATFEQDNIVIPIFADLKLYRGSLRELIDQTLPESLPFQELIGAFKVKIFLDSFNEMPREFWESGSYERDFSGFIAGLGGASLIIGSRTNDGLSGLGLETYHLDEIEEHTVHGEMTRLGMSLEGRFSREMLRLLQRPFYFQYIVTRQINLPENPHPKDFYKSLLGGAGGKFSSGLKIEQALASVAYDALNRGEEAFPVSSMLNVFNEILPDEHCIDIVNRLISESILVPYTKSRIGFIHQSVTEYLAATELARRYILDSSLLKEKLSLRRWDQALFLTLSLLPQAQADSFLEDVMAIDISLALNASKYIEFDREDVTTRLLSRLHDICVTEGLPSYKVESAMRDGLQVGETHEKQIYDLVAHGDSFGGAAAGLLISIKGSGAKQEIFQMVLDRFDDFNFCSNACSSLAKFIGDDDVPSIMHLVDEFETRTSKLDCGFSDCEGFFIGVTTLLEDIELSVIRAATLREARAGRVGKVRGKLLCEVLGDRRSTEALCLAGELLLEGLDDAAIAIYFISNFSSSEDAISWDGLSSLHALRLMEIIENQWAFRALQQFCKARPDIYSLVRNHASTKSGFLKAILLFCTEPEKIDHIKLELDNILNADPGEYENLPIDLISNIDFYNHADIVIRFLELRNSTLASALLGNSLVFQPAKSGSLQIDNIEWWLEWMIEESCSEGGKWFSDRLGNFLVTNCELSVRNCFLEEFNRSDTKFRQIILQSVLPSFDFTTDDLTDSAISFLLANLERGRAEYHGSCRIIGSSATELFVVERLLPLLPNAQEPLKRNLLRVLEQAGSRHGRRYIINNY